MVDSLDNLHTSGVLKCQNHKCSTDIVKDGIVMTSNVRHIDSDQSEVGWDNIWIFSQKEAILVTLGLSSQITNKIVAIEFQQGGALAKISMISPIG